MVKGSDSDLRRKIGDALESVSFSQEKKEELVKDLVQARRTKRRRHTVLMAAANFWNGSVDLPLPAVPGMAVVAGVFVWSSIADLLAVDPSTAIMLLQTGKETVDQISQGVSIL